MLDIFSVENISLQTYTTHLIQTLLLKGFSIDRYYDAADRSRQLDREQVITLNSIQLNLNDGDNEMYFDDTIGPSHEHYFWWS